MPSPLKISVLLPFLSLSSSPQIFFLFSNLFFLSLFFPVLFHLFQPKLYPITTKLLNLTLLHSQHKKMMIEKPHVY